MNKVQGKGWWEYKRSVKPDKFEANVTAGNMGLIGDNNVNKLGGWFIDGSNSNFSNITVVEGGINVYA